MDSSSCEVKTTSSKRLLQFCSGPCPLDLVPHPLLFVMVFSKTVSATAPSLNVSAARHHEENELRYVNRRHRKITTSSSESQNKRVVHGVITQIIKRTRLCRKAENTKNALTCTAGRTNHTQLTHSFLTQHSPPEIRTEEDSWMSGQRSWTRNHQSI